MAARLTSILLLTVLLVVACKAPVDQATAIGIASDFALKSQPAGTQIRGIHETAVDEVGNAWRIEISFDALAAGRRVRQPGAASPPHRRRQGLRHADHRRPGLTDPVTLT